MFLSFKGAGMPEQKIQLQNLLLSTAKVSIINPACHTDQRDSNTAQLFSVQNIPCLSMSKSNQMNKGHLTSVVSRFSL